MRMSRALSSDKYRVAYAALMLWAWADDLTEDGYIGGADYDMVDDVVDLQGFASAAESIGWIENLGDGLNLPGWEKYNGQSAKRRQMDAERQAKGRSKKRVKQSRGNVTGVTETRDMPSQKTVTRKEKSRSNNNPPNPPSAKGGTGSRKQTRAERQRAELLREREIQDRLARERGGSV